MNTCCICKIDLVGKCLICGDYFNAWPKGKTFAEYMAIQYDPEKRKHLNALKPVQDVA